MKDDDVTKLVEISQQLSAIDLDSPSSERIAYRVRRDLGHGPSSWRFIEPILVTAFTASVLVWSALKVLEAFR